MSAPTSTPSQSPITASVVKFRCLYTHDLRRKSKRWQDGYLRYHAFNKRVMVYDDHGNYIGDHHWRSPDEVQDGDELELDKGVLIEVGERMGTTQQDLTNLFEKRKSSQTSPSSNHLQARPTPTPTPALAPASTPTYTPMTASTSSTPARPPGSQSFRSLNDLLGIKRTPVGHRPSPYEERHPQTSSLPDSSERAPKRLRVAATTTPFQSKKVQSEVVDLTVPEPQPPAKPPSPPTPREKTRPLKDVIPNRPASVKEPQLNPKEASPITQQSSRQDPPTFKKPALPRPPEIRTRPKPNPTPPEEAPAEVQTARVNPTSAQDTPDNDRLRNPRNSRPNSTFGAEVPAQPIKTLRMATEKPRRKLMYSALLPSDPSQRSSPSSAMGPPEKRSQSAPKLKESQPASVPSQGPASTNMEFLPSVSTQFILDEIVGNPDIDTNQSRDSREPPHASQPALARNPPAKRSLDAPLRKSLSDPTALIARSGLQTRPSLMRNALSTVPEQEQEIEQGPWTSEALDLFDFWPPGRAKPC